MKILRWNLAALLLAIVAGMLSFSVGDPRIAKASQSLFLVFLVVVLSGLIVQSLRWPGPHR